MQILDSEKVVDMGYMAEDMVDTEVDMEEALEDLEEAKDMEVVLEVEKDMVALEADMEDMGMAKEVSMIWKVEVKSPQNMFAELQSILHLQLP